MGGFSSADGWKPRHTNDTTRRAYLRGAGTAGIGVLSLPLLASRGRAALSQTLTIEGTGSRASYRFSVSGDLEKSTANGANINGNDEISGSSASGVVGISADSYTFSGELIAFDLDGRANVTLDGEPAHVGQRPDHVLTIQGTGSRATYTFSVSNELEKITANGANINTGDEISESTATGEVGISADSYVFSGELEAFALDEEANVILDGEPLNPDDYPEHVLTIEGTGSRASYRFSVSDDLEKSTANGANINSGDEISESSATGVVGISADSYSFSGDLTSFELGGEANVTLDGEPFDSTQYSSHILTIEGTGSRATYRFSVSGELAKSTANGANINGNDEISGSSATGEVGISADSYRFSGTLTDISLDGDANVFVDGELMDTGPGNTDDANDLKLGYDARARSHDLGNTYEDFGDFSAGWEPKQGEIASNGGPGGDWEDPADDAGHATLISDGSNNRVEMVNDTFSENFAYRDVSMAVRLRGVSNETLRVELAAGDGSEKQVTTRYLSEKHGWVRMSLSPSAWTGTPDMADINEFSISCYTGGKSCEIDVDDIRTTPKRDNGAVLFTFDDGNETDSTIAYDELSARGMAGTSAVIPRMVGNDGKLSTDQLDAMHGDDWAVCLHPQHGQGLGSVSEDQAREWIEENKQWQLDNGYTRGANTLIWPFGDFDEDAMNIAGEYCNLSFGGGSSSVGGTITEASWVPRVELNEDDDAAKAHEMIELAYKTDTVVVFMTHRMGGSNLSRSTFADLLDQVEYRGLDVLTTADFAGEQ
ncbi:polysaccharide deacetylase family protein [Halococcus sp. AFM35]|uniref:polysaccharide deacetylase family protein n=1 Tax=Halococcus sp. AFM35 TaxID=3421653 RepID=UPI003EBCCC14